jgi:DNA-binding GntR family transcriptional regulator
MGLQREIVDRPRQGGMSPRPPARRPDAARLGPVRHESLVDLAYGSVRASIVSGRIAMGERLVETRLAAELGVSRAPVREALRRLREEQLVVDVPRRGSVVRTFDGDDLVHIYNLRIIVEIGAVRLAIRSGASTAPLRAKIRRMTHAARRGDASGVATAELEFHEALIEAAANPYLTAVFRTVSAQIRIAAALGAGRPDLAATVGEHRLLVDRIAAGDEEEAVLAVRRHLAATVDAVLRGLGDATTALLAPPVAGD